MPTVISQTFNALAIGLALMGLVSSAAYAVERKVDPLGLGLYDTVLESKEQTAEHIAQAKAHGIGVLYPSISGGGSALWVTQGENYYPSYQVYLDAGYDSLADFIEQAHAVGLKVYPSVAVAPAAKMIVENPEWETRDRNGKPSSVTGPRSLAMSIPEARAARIACIMDLVNDYDIDGVMLDYCRYPEHTASEETKYGFYGYDPPLIDACQSLYGFDPREVPIDSPQWNQFAQMRRDTVTAFVREMRDAIVASGRNVRLGGYGDTNPEFEAQMCGRDVVAWSQQGLIDDYFLATYQEKPPVVTEVVRQVREAAGPHVTLRSALTPFHGFAKTGDEMRAAAKAQLKGGAAGLWIYRSDFMPPDLWEGAGAVSRMLERHR